MSAGSGETGPFMVTWLPLRVAGVAARTINHVAIFSYTMYVPPTHLVASHICRIASKCVLSSRIFMVAVGTKCHLLLLWLSVSLVVDIRAKAKSNFRATILYS